MKAKLNKRNFLKKIKSLFSKISNLQIILIVYFITTFGFALLLLIPYAHKDGVEVGFIDALFTAASAFSDTGLTTLTTVDTWSWFGQFIIATLILLGGIGIFALKVWIVNVIFRKSISISSRNILEKERGSSNTGELKKTIKISITFLFATIIIATLILWPIFYFEKGNFIWDYNQINYGFILTSDAGNYQFADPYHDPLKSFVCAVFHSISAINNAGFDILSNNSLFPYYHVYSIQIVFIVLLVIGGVGFPVIYDTIQYIKAKARRRSDFRFSLFSKVSCLTYLLVFLVGLLLTLTFELGNKNGKGFGIWDESNTIAGSIGDRVMCTIFHVFSTRNAGFTTLNPNLVRFTNATLIVFSIMMFIGSAPSSTAGGLRTTTLAIIVVAIWNRMRGIKEVRMFKRKIKSDAVFSSFVVLALSVFVVLFTSLVCFTSLNTMWGDAPAAKLTFADIFYDVCSAYGTTGLSTGLTSNLNIGSKLIMIVTMFIGQLGISSTMLVWRKNNPKNDYSYIEEEILIG